MSRISSHPAPVPARKHRGRMAWLLLAIVPVMFAFAFANIPLFRVWCEHYGIAVAPVNRADAAAVDGRTLSMMFTGEVSTALPIQFEPKDSLQRVKVGERVENAYTFFNPTDQPIRFRAIHAIYPEAAAKKLALMQCFCFSDQELAPHQTKTLPVIYEVNPGLPGTVTEVTLNYTLFPK